MGPAGPTWKTWIQSKFSRVRFVKILQFLVGKISRNSDDFQELMNSVTDKISPYLIFDKTCHPQKLPALGWNYQSLGKIPQPKKKHQPFHISFWKNGQLRTWRIIAGWSKYSATMVRKSPNWGCSRSEWPFHGVFQFWGDPTYWSLSYSLIAPPSLDASWPYNLLTFPIGDPACMRQTAESTIICWEASLARKPRRPVSNFTWDDTSTGWAAGVRSSWKGQAHGWYTTEKENMASWKLNKNPNVRYMEIHDIDSNCWIFPPYHLGFPGWNHELFHFHLCSFAGMLGWCGWPKTVLKNTTKGVSIMTGQPTPLPHPPPEIMI